MRRQGVQQMWSVREHQNIKTRLYHRIYIAFYLNCITTIGRKRASNDADLVQPEQYIILKNKRAKIPPPEPWPLLDFNPLSISLPLTNSALNLPPYIDPTNPLALFKLI